MLPSKETTCGVNIIFSPKGLFKKMRISNITQDLLGFEWKEFNDARKDEVLSFLSKM